MASVACGNAAAPVRVSVIIPHYNDSAVIGRQLHGIAAQTLPPWEVIVMDDGSTAEELARLRAAIAGVAGVRVIERDRNEGAAAACNAGLAAATGEYVCFLACDDQILPRLFEAATDLLERYPAAAFSFSDLTLVSPASGQITPIALRLSSRPVLLQPRQIIAALPRYRFMISTNTSLFRRTMIGPGMPPVLGSFGDAFLAYALAFRHGAIYMPGIWGHFYLTPASYGQREHASSATMRALTAAMLGLLDDIAFADVAGSFRAAGILPEYSLRALGWLMADSRGRGYLTLRLIRRCIGETARRMARPFVPMAMRLWLRRTCALRPLIDTC